MARMSARRARRRRSDVRNVALGLVLAVVILVVAAVSALFFVDPNDYKGDIAALGREATGREVTLAGPLALHISLHPTLSAEDVRVANAAWGSAPDMVRLGRVEAEIDPWPLLSGEVRIRRLKVRGLDVLLERNAAGRGNWELAPAGTPAQAAEAGEGGSGGAIPVPLHLALDDVRITYRGRGGPAHVVALKRLTGDADSVSSDLRVALEARVDGEPLRGEATLGPPATLAEGTAPYPVRFALRGLDASLDVDGSIADIAGAPRPLVRVAARVAAPAALAHRFGASLPALPAVALNAQLAGSAGVYEVRDLDLAVGQSRLKGSVKATTTGARPRIEAILAGERLDLRPAQAPAPAPGPPAAADGERDPPAGKLFPRRPLPLDGLRAVDARLALTLGEVLTPEIDARDVHVAVSLEDGRLAVAPIEAVVAGSHVKGALSLDAAKAPPVLALSLAAPKLDLGALAKDAGAGDVLEARGDLALKLQGHGRSVAEIMGSLGGETTVLVGKGRVEAEALDLAVGGLTTVLGSLFARDAEGSELNCAASHVVFADGVGTIKAMLVDTAVSSITGEGTVDLGRERLALTITPRPKSVTLDVAVPVKVDGPLASPSVTPDELAAATRVGGLIGSILFPPAALLAFGDLGAGDNACVKSVPGKGTAKPAPAANQGTGGIGGTLERLFGR